MGGYQTGNTVAGILGTSSVEITDGVDTALVSPTGRLMVDASGATGGVEYTEGDTDAAITGGVIMWEDAADTIRPVSAAKPLPVTVVTAPQITVDTRRAMSPLFAVISTATSGDQQIIAADATKKIKVLSYALVAEGTVAVTWKSATTALSGAMPLVVNTGAAVTGGTTGAWLMETAVNQALNLNLSANIGVRGHIAYFLEA